MNLLSDRVRAGSEAAPWVIEEIKKLERDALRYRAIRQDLEMFGTYDCGFRKPEDVDEAADFLIKKKADV